MRAADLTGQVFGSLRVIALLPRLGRRVWECDCVCGSRHMVTTSNLRSGSVTNCGCLISANRKKASLKHGNNRFGQRTKEYRAWAHILGRCSNPADAAYKDYGGRGITMDLSWRSSFDVFLLDMGRAPSPLHSVDRIDNDGPYNKANCRWATPAQQSRNTRRTILIDGKCLKDVCEDRGLSYDAVQARLRRGDALHVALSALTGNSYRALRAALANSGERQ